VTGQPLTKTVTESSTNLNFCANNANTTCYNTTCARYRGNGTCRTWNQDCTCTGYLSRCMIDRHGIASVAERALAAGVETVAFDRAGFKFHGRVKALADAAREGGLKF